MIVKHQKSRAGQPQPILQQPAGAVQRHIDRVVEKRAAKERAAEERELAASGIILAPVASIARPAGS
jgi:hypothetical protein